jgi:Putative Ig domain
MTDIVHDTTALPDAFVGQAYSAAVAFHGAATALIPADSALAAVTNGAPDGTTNLPGGLSINTTTNGTVISGTPTAAHGAGTYSLKVTLQDTAGAVQSSTITLALHAQSIQDAGGFDQVTSDPAFSSSAQYTREWPVVQ